MNEVLETADTVKQDGVISIPRGYEMDWIPLDTTQDGNVPGPVWKLFRHVPGKATTFMTHIPPGWKDDVLDWHPGTEEVFKLAGAVDFPDNRTTKWSYLYRPPGILHGPVSVPGDDGTTSITRMTGDLRILRYEGDEFPHVHKQPITDQWKTWPVEWNENTDLLNAPWISVTEGPWAGIEMKLASRNKATGGCALLMRLPAGWSGQGSLGRGPVEEFVVEGTVQIGDVEYRKWGYMYRPKGNPAGGYSTEKGAIMFCFWDEADELLP